MVDESSVNKKAKGVNRSNVATISHNEYKDILLNNKCLRHLMNRVQSKNHRKGTYKIKNVLYPALMIKYIFYTMDMMD